MIVLVLGVSAGIAVPLVFSLPHWVTAVVLMGLFIAVLLEGTYNVWHATERERATLASRETQRLADETQRLTHANLDFELRSEEGELFLYIHNLGPAEARAISVSGALSNGMFENIFGFASVIQPNAKQGVLINPSGYQIVAGHSRWELEVNWEDGSGRHEKEHFLATRRTS